MNVFSGKPRNDFEAQQFPLSIARRAPLILEACGVFVATSAIPRGQLNNIAIRAGEKRE